MKTNMGYLGVALSILYYIGIVSMIYLYIIDDNSSRWLITYFMLLAGFLGTCIADALMNVGVEKISLSLSRTAILLKGLIFLVIYIFIKVSLDYTVVSITILCLASVVVEIFLWIQVIKTDTSVYTFFTLSDAIDTSGLDATKKYFILDGIGAILFFCIHDTKVGLIVTLLISLIIHIYSLEKILPHMYTLTNRSRCIARIILWAIWLLAMLFAYLNHDFLFYFMASDYYMIASDWLIDRKNKLIKLKRVSENDD